MRFLSSASRIEQLDKKRMYRLLDNELYLDDDGSVYLAWLGTLPITLRGLMQASTISGIHTSTILVANIINL